MENNLVKMKRSIKGSLPFEIKGPLPFEIKGPLPFEIKGPLPFEIKGSLPFEIWIFRCQPDRDDDRILL
jgi:hypothetical protein